MDIWKDNSVASRKERWRALWAMEDLPRPLWFVPATPVLGSAISWAAQGRSLRALFLDRDIQFDASMKFNRFVELAQRVWSRDDFVFHLQPQMGVGVFASAFGCESKFPPDQMPWVHALIKPGDPAEKVYDIAPPDIRDGYLGDILDFAEYFDKKANYKYPIAMTDLQGPLDTAYLIWNACDFMIAMYEHPAEVHRLMRLVTDLIIKFVKEYRSKVREMVPAHFPMVYLPDGQGITLSEDALAVLSPHCWEEFSLPYINELSEEFGGVLIHSCGNIGHQLEALKKVHKLRGINFGVSETRFEAVWEAFGGKTVVIPHCSAEIIVANFKNALEWIEYVLRKKTHNRGLALMVFPVVGDIHKMNFNIATGRKVSIDKWETATLGYNIRKLIARYS